MTVHPLLRRLYERWSPADSRLAQRATFDFAFALIYIVVLHGFSAGKILAILYANYSLATRLPRAWVPAATWIFNVGTLFANELAGGYQFASMARRVSPEDSLLLAVARWLDEHGGIIARWEILFNITVLRLISFNLDYYWSRDARDGSPLEVSGRVWRNYR